jgi:V8-like Glu-specific endopeptidase
MKKVSIFVSLVILTFLSCKESVKPLDKEFYAKEGKKVVKATFKKMGGEVEAKMKKGGVKETVPFCNKEASKLISSMQEKFNVSIKRTSLKLRNEDNTPTAGEQKVLEKFAAIVEKGEKLKPIVEQDQAGKIHFYAPIKLKKKCLTCHGQVGSSMEQASDSIIKKLYPNDKATGYKEGDFRGMWNVTFDPKK